MLNMMLSDVEKITNGLLQGEDGQICSIVIDSRNAIENSLFVAIKGEHVDGHDYLDQALKSGATGALVENYVDSQLPQIKVRNSVKAMADIAKACRSEYAGIVIGITGSCGKTTTKEMLVSILSLQAKVSATKGNRNNEIGVPLTLFDAERDSDFYVIEMGAAQQGDIAYLMDMVRPDISVITNVRSAHIGRFGSESMIASTKSEIYRHLEDGAMAVVNLDEKYSSEWINLLQENKKYTYSIDNKKADVYATNIVVSSCSNRFTLNYNGDEQEVSMRVPGMHNIANALCAATCAIAAGRDLHQIAQALSIFVPIASRLQKMQGAWGGVLIDDTYNANPASVKAAIDVLSKYPGRRILVLGDMAELGDSSEVLHAEIGAYARKSVIDAMYTWGKQSAIASDKFGESAKHFTDKKALSDYILSEIGIDDVVLVKGSRSAVMEEVVGLLKEKVIQ